MFYCSITSSHCLPCPLMKWRKAWGASCALQIAGEGHYFGILTSILFITEAQLLTVFWHYCHRLRPDIRKLEEGDIDGAAAVKTRLEEKQRDARKARKGKKGLDWTPRHVSVFMHLYGRLCLSVCVIHLCKYHIEELF